MVPFVYGTADSLKCFDESSPCTEEQTAFCVVDIAQKSDPSSQFPGQDKIVPWTICKDSGGSLESCHSQVGINTADVTACMNDSERMQGLISKYLARAQNVQSTPREEVDGKKVGNMFFEANYKRVSRAICKADKSLPACTSFIEDDVQV